MITLKKVKIEGFGSIVREVKYKIDRPGLNIITGRVGAGKTTILDAILWAIYGVKSKKDSIIEPWEHLQDDEYRGTKIELQFEKDGIEYLIIRCKEFKGKVNGSQGNNRLLFYEGGQACSTKDKREIQKDITKAIGYSYELFKSSVFFGQRVSRFMEESGPVKKKIMEEAFEVAFISKANELVDKKIRALEIELEPLYSQRTWNEVVIKTSLETIDTLEKGKAEFLKDKKKRLLKAKKEIKEIKKGRINKLAVKQEIREIEIKVKKLLAKKALLSNAEQDYQDAKDALFKHETNAWGVTNQLDAVGNKHNALTEEYKNLPKTCKTCGRAFDPKSRKEATERIMIELSKLRKERSRLVKLGVEIHTVGIQLQGVVSRKEGEKKEHSSLEGQIRVLEIARAKLRLVLKDAEHYEHTLKLAKKNLSEIKTLSYAGDTSVPQKAMEKAEEELGPVRSTIQKLEKKMELLKWAKKDPLSNSGLKAFIFDSMMGKLNRELKKYESTLGFRIKMGVKLESANKDFYVLIEKKGGEVSSSDLSGGQTQLTNLAIAWSCHDVISTPKPINCVFLDECFEGLGDPEIELVSDLIRKRIKGKSIHLITHRNFNPVNSYRTEVRLNDKGHSEIYSKLQQG